MDLALLAGAPDHFLERDHAGAPGAEVLGGELLAHRLADIVVDVARSDRARAAVLAQIFEQMLSRQLLGPSRDPGEPAIRDRHGPLDAMLAGEADPQLVAGHAGMAVAQGGRAEALVRLRIFLVADPHVGRVDQPHDGGDHRLAAGRIAGHVRRDALAQRRQLAAERRQPLIFAAVAPGPEIGMIAILPPPARIIADALDVAVRVGAEPDPLISRRHTDRVEPVDLVAVGDPFPVRSEILPIAPAPFAADPGRRVVDIFEAGRLGHERAQCARRLFRSAWVKFAAIGRNLCTRRREAVSSSGTNIRRCRSWPGHGSCCASRRLPFAPSRLRVKQKDGFCSAVLRRLAPRPPPGTACAPARARAGGARRRSRSGCRSPSR